MRDVCNQCGGTVTNRLLQRSDRAAVVHRECANGHKQHRVTGEVARQSGDPPEEQSAHFVVVEPCDCDSGEHEVEAREP